MALFNGVDTLLEMFMPGQENQAKDNLVRRSDLDQNDFSKVASIGLPAIISALNRNNQSEQGLESFNNTLSRHQDVRNYNSLDQLTQDVDPNEGDKILNHVFNQNENEKQGVIDRIADTLGITPAAVKRVLMAPVVLKYFADRKDDNNLDARGVQKESGNLSDVMTRSIRDYSSRARQNPTNQGGGIFGDLFGGGNNSQPTRRPQQTQQQQDGGLLDNILDMFF